MKKSTKKKCSHNVNDFRAAFEAVCGGMSVSKASNYYKIPKNSLFTLLRCMKMIPPRKAASFAEKPAPALSRQQESQLTNWILTCSGSGYPRLSRKAISAEARSIVQAHVDTANIELNKHWFHNYCTRYPLVADAVINTPEWRNCLDDTQLCTWFQHIGTYLCEGGVEEVRQQPQRVFHCMCGCYRSINTILAYSAGCRATPPLLLLPPAAKNVGHPNGWAHYNCTNSPDIDDTVLLYYLERVFCRYLKHINIEFPVILYVDHQRQPPGHRVFELCSQLGIVLVNLYPHAFKNLHQDLSHCITQWQLDPNTQHYENEYTRTVEALKHAFVYTLLKRKMVQSFQDYGIYPLYLSATDMTELAPNNKCAADRKQVAEVDSCGDNNRKESWTVYIQNCSSDTD